MLNAVFSWFERRYPATALAEDLTGWLGGVALRLQPFTLVDEPTRRLVEQCTALIERQSS